MRAQYIEHTREDSAPGNRGPGCARPTEALIDRAALTRNFNQVLRRAAGRKILAVVKAQAYGHGAVDVSKHLLKLGTDQLGVALVEEGRELRAAGIDAPILVMGAVFPEQAESVLELGLSPAVFTADLARALSAASLRRRKSVSVHVKIDTGMGRLGLRPEAALPFLEDLKSLPGIEVQGLMTHFADADSCEKQFCAEQVRRFEGLLSAMKDRGIEVPFRHAANSAALLSYPQALFTMVRPGLMLYGYNPLSSGTEEPDLEPVLSLKTRVAFLKRVPAHTPISYGRTFMTRRESLIATIPIGYADGYSRALSGRGEALVRGTRVPVIGRICMDMCMLDVSGVPGVREQDEVVLIGRQGAEKITANDIAQLTGTIAYEVLCGIGNRVQRVFV